MENEYSNSSKRSLSFAGFSLDVSFFEDAQHDTVSFWEGDEGFLISDDEDVSFSGSEGFSIGVLDVDDIEGSQMSFDVLDLSDSTDIVSTGDVAEFSRGVGDPAFDLVLLEVVFDGVTFSDFGVGESDGSGIVGNDVGDFVGSDGSGFDFTELVVGFGIFNFDDHVSALDVIEKSIVFSGFGDMEYIHNTNWELSISSDFIIYSESSFLVHDC